MAGRTIQLALILAGRLNPTLMNAFNRATQLGNRLGQTVDRSMRTAGTGANNLSSNIRNSTLNVIALNQALELSIKTMNGVSKITGFVDQYTSGTARLNMVNDGLQTTAEMQDMIFESAQRSRGSYVDMTANASKLALLAKDNFKDFKEAAYFGEILTKSFAVAGASTQEMQAGTYQLTQAMAAGKLQGDEFRSMTENAPLVADAISKYLNIPKGVLKEISSEGLITADIVKNAIYMASDDINKKFESMPVTFGNAMTSLANIAFKNFSPVMERISNGLNSDRGQQLITDLVELINIAVDAAEFALPKFSYALKWAQDNGDTLLPIIGGITAALVAFKVASIGAAIIGTLAPILANVAFAITAVIGGAATFGEAMLFITGPVGWAILAIGALVAAGIYLYKNWDTVSIYLQNIGIFIKKCFFGFIDHIIKKINWFIEKINMIPGINVPLIAKVEYQEEYKSLGHLEKLPDGVQGPELLKFAQGGIVTSPTFGLLGEAGYVETVVPHINTPRSRNLLQSAAAGVGIDIGRGGNTINVYVTSTGNDDGKKIGYEIADVLSNDRRLSFG